MAENSNHIPKCHPEESVATFIGYLNGMREIEMA